MRSFSRPKAQPSKVTQTGNNATSHNAVEDNRPEAVAQNKERELTMNSPRNVAQRKTFVHAFGSDISDPNVNNTGMPDHLKNGLEQLSGVALSDVRVHYNSARPSQVNALAFAQGNDIHIAPGQEKHLPHEGWHVVQQKQGRVKPTLQLKSGLFVNDDQGLETEADIMGDSADQFGEQPEGSGHPQTAATGGIHHISPGGAADDVGGANVEADGGSLRLFNLNVNEAHRGQGHGKAIIDKAARLAKTKGLSTVTLESEDNGSGRLTHWYQEQGFSKKGKGRRGMEVMTLQLKQDHVIQKASDRPDPPKKAGPTAIVYLPGKVRGLTPNPISKKRRWHCINATNHWIYCGNGVWRKLPTKKVPLHGRVNFAAPSGRGAIRAKSYAAKHGSGASYFPGKDEKKMDGSAEAKIQGGPKKGKRTYREKMKLLVGTGSATEYAASCGAPVIDGGYNWCHLVGRGAGGPDEPHNLVAASTHANSEHLLVERIIYHHKQDNFTIKHEYQSLNRLNGLKIARKTVFKVIVDGNVIFTRYVDGFRKTKPTDAEMKAVEEELMKAIGNTLKNAESKIDRLYKDE